MKALQMAKIFSDYSSPWNLYRATYKYTECGPSVGMEINGKRLYCSDLPNEWVGEITLIMVSSIVEGVDEETECYEIDVDASDNLNGEYWDTVERVNREARAIWDNTHGCETCAELMGVEYEIGNTPVFKHCPSCGGHGEVI